MLYLILGKARKSGKSEQVIKKVRKKQERNKKNESLRKTTMAYLVHWAAQNGGRKADISGVIT